MTFTTQQLAATSGSIDSFTLTPTASVSGGGNVAGMNGILVLPSTSASGTTVSTARGFTSWPQIAAGTTITNYYAVSILNPNGSGTITNNFGVRVDNQTIGTNNYGVYVEGASTYAIWSDSGLNRFDGDVQLGGVITGIPGTNNTKIQASGSTIGNTNNGSIYFLDSSGNTSGRLDTAKTNIERVLGDGSDGAITVSSSVNINTTPIATGRVTYADGIAYRVNAPGSGDISVTRYRAADTLSNGLVAGDEVLLINMQGLSTNVLNSFGTDTASVGNYEIKKVASVSASTITFTTPVERRFVGLNANNQRVIVQRIPQYTNVTVNSGGTITASGYDSLVTVPTGGAGYLTGIVAFRASGTVTVNTGGAISVNGLGYRGGAAGAAGANGGFNGESYDHPTNNGSGQGGSGATDNASWGGGRSSNNPTASPGNHAPRGGGGGGGSNGSASTGDDGSGAGGGGGYGGGGGGGGGGSNQTAGLGGAGGTGGQTDIPGGGGGGGQSTVAAGAAGGNAGSAGSSATGTGGAVGFGANTGSGGGGTAGTAAGGAGGGGGGLYGDPYLENLFLGSGGGGGAGGFSTNTAGAAGGNGGGMVFITAGTLTMAGTGSITANGAAGTNGTAPASGGGGGSGGSIRIEAVTATLGSSLILTHGGVGGTTAARRGTSGGGGVGRIYVEYYTSQSGTTSPSATVAQVSNNYGTLYIGNINTTEADLAEYYISGDTTMEAGDVVSISPYKVVSKNEEQIVNQGVLRKTEVAYDSKLVGVISTAPGITLGSKDSNGQADQRALALKGRVPVKIDPDSEPISIGDFLTSSSRPGYAKKATEPGYVIGKALEYWNKNLNKSRISTFVDLGYYYGGNSTSQEALALANNIGLSISGYDIPSKVINVISKAGSENLALNQPTQSTGNTLGISTDNTTEVTSDLEKGIKLALGSSELTDYYPTSDASITSGDVVKFNSNQDLVKSDSRGDVDVLGVVSTQPNILLKSLIDSELNRTVGLGGKAVVKISLENGPIKKGDYLAASSTPGYAMKADNANGVVIGRSLEDFPLSVSSDSALVTKELNKNKTEATNILLNEKVEGSISENDYNKYIESLNVYYATKQTDTADSYQAGRIMAMINIGYITEGLMLPRNVNVEDGSVPGAVLSSNTSDMQKLILALQGTKLTLNNILTVKNVIEAQTYQNITGLDLAFKITSASNSFKVLNMNDESLFSVNQDGKISIKEGEGSSIGEVTFNPQTVEMFVENKSVTDASKIYLTPNEFIVSKVESITPGVGFTVKLQNVMDKEVKVNYLIIN